MAETMDSGPRTDALAVSAFLNAATALIAREKQAGRFPSIWSSCKPIVLKLARIARGMMEDRSGSALDLLLATAGTCDDWLFKAAACHVALEEGRRDLALPLAEAATLDMHIDLYAQELWLRSRDEEASDSSLAAIDEDLRGRFCDRPFKWMEFTADTTKVCCGSWLPVAIGSAPSKPEEVWNGAVAQELRRSILDGSFRYCSRVHCPWIAKKSLPRREEVDLDQYALVMPPPTALNLCYDPSCNLSCPSCRTRIFAAGKPQQESFGAYYETAVAPLIPTAETVNITGSGDPFSSRHYRQLLKHLSAMDGLRIDIQTNGVLFDDRAWDDLSLNGKVRRIWVSLDAAKAETYKKVRRDGDFERAKRNIRAIVQNRQARGIEFIGLDFVVQEDNVNEMLDFVCLGVELGVDSVRFNMIRNWWTFSGSEFADKFVGSKSHPNYTQFLAALAAPMFLHPIVDTGNLSCFGPCSSTIAGERDRNVLHT
ncbi:radical SAM protein [Azospirillum sp. sgz301742]